MLRSPRLRWSSSRSDSAPPRSTRRAARQGRGSPRARACGVWRSTAHATAAPTAHIRMPDGQCSSRLKICPARLMPAPSATVPTACSAADSPGTLSPTSAASDVEPAHHAQDDREPRRRRQRVPVRGHEQQHASAEHQRAKGDGHHDRPPQLAGAGMCQFRNRGCARPRPRRSARPRPTASARRSSRS